MRIFTPRLPADDFFGEFGTWADGANLRYGFTEEALACVMDNIGWSCLAQHGEQVCIGVNDAITCQITDVTEKTHAYLAALPGVGPAAMRVLAQFLRDKGLKLANGWPKS